MRAAATEPQRVAILACGLTACTQLVFAAIDARTLSPWPHAALDLGHAVLAAAVAGAVWARRGHPGTLLPDLGVALVALAYLPVLWLGELDGVALGQVRTVTMTHQLLIVGIALLAPHDLRLAGGLIAVVTGSAVALVAVLKARAPYLVLTAEPWTTMAFAGVATGLLLSRRHRRIVSERLARAQVEVEALARLARVVLAMRDRVNSPLQTLELGTAMLTDRHPDSAPLLEPMRRSAERLAALFAQLDRVDRWADVSPDVTVDLAEELSALTSGRRRADAPPASERDPG